MASMYSLDILKLQSISNQDEILLYPRFLLQSPQGIHFSIAL